MWIDFVEIRKKKGERMRKGIGKKTRDKKVCRGCLLKVKEEWKYCPRCGSDLVIQGHILKELLEKTQSGKWFCPHCLNIKDAIKTPRGKFVPKYCTDCGIQLQYRV